MNNSRSRQQSLVIRQATEADLPAIHQLVARVYTEMTPYSIDQLRGHLNHFPAGNCVAEYDGRIVGYSASLRAKGERVLKPHDWNEITGHGYGNTDEPAGDHLYGYEVCVDPEFRGLRIGERLYSARRKLCVDLKLKGIVFGGRLPGLSKRIREFGTPQKYVDAVVARKIRDQVLSFQLRHGFELLGVLENYLKSDRESMGCAAHLIWRNPAAATAALTEGIGGPGRTPSSVRVAVVQFQQRRISSFDEFVGILRYFVDVVSDNKADFVLFPEYYAFQLLSLEKKDLKPAESFVRLAEYNDRLEEVLREMAIRFNVNIIAGSHPAKTADGKIQNVAHAFLRDGSVYEQPKVHPTPAEKQWWQVEGGDYVRAIKTDCGTIGILICYDAEFPELARHLVNQGAVLLFVPFSTEERNGYLRVRYCAQARAVENQVYVASAGNIGNLPRVQNMDIHYAQSFISTPCDFPFARDGVAADTTPNVEMIAFADLSMEALMAARSHGTVQNIKDRRHDLYAVHWRGPSEY